MKWFKFYGQDFLSDSRIGSLNPLQRLMWVTLLCVASQDDEKSGIIKFISEKHLKALCGITDNPNNDDWERTDVTLETFCNMGLVTMPDRNTIIVKNYHRKQTESSTSTERVSAWRAKKNKVILENENNKKHVTNETNVTLQSNGRVEKSRIDKLHTSKVATKVARVSKLSNDEWRKIIDSFEAVNPMYRDFYKNTTERSAIEALVEQIGFDKLVATILALPEITSQEFAPKISKPTELRRDFGKLLTFYRQKTTGLKTKQVIL